MLLLVRVILRTEDCTKYFNVLIVEVNISDYLRHWNSLHFTLRKVQKNYRYQPQGASQTNVSGYRQGVRYPSVCQSPDSSPSTLVLFWVEVMSGECSTFGVHHHRKSTKHI